MACEHCVKRIKSLDRLPNSASGDPHYLVTFTDGSLAITQSDARFVDGITNPVNPEMRGDLIVTYSRAGRITDMRPV